MKHSDNACKQCIDLLLIHPFLQYHMFLKATSYPIFMMSFLTWITNWRHLSITEYIPGSVYRFGLHLSNMNMWYVFQKIHIFLQVIDIHYNILATQCLWDSWSKVNLQYIVILVKNSANKRLALKYFVYYFSRFSAPTFCNYCVIIRGSGMV